MRVQNISQNNYQNKNVGFGTSCTTFLRGARCPKISCESVCQDFADVAANILLGRAIEKGLIDTAKNAKAIASQTVEGVRVWILDLRTASGRKLAAMPEGETQVAALTKASESQSEDMVPIEMTDEGVHEAASLVKVLRNPQSLLRTLFQ